MPSTLMKPLIKCLALSPNTQTFRHFWEQRRRRETTPDWRLIECLSIRTVDVVRREIHTSRCCRTLSTCLSRSAKFMCEETSRGWIHLYWMTEPLPYVGPAGSWELYPYFPLGGRTQNEREDAKRRRNKEEPASSHTLSTGWYDQRFCLLAAAMVASYLSGILCVVLEHLRWTALLKMPLLL